LFKSINIVGESDKPYWDELIQVIRYYQLC